MKRIDIINKTTKRIYGAVEVKKRNITFEMGNDPIENIRISEREYKFKELVNALSTLKPKEQQIIAYRFFENKTQAQIGELMNISQSTAQRWINKAVLSLGRALYGMEKEFWDKFK